MSDSFFGMEAMFSGSPEERLQRARDWLGRLVSTETASVQDGVELAWRLRGVPRAITEIVLAKGTLEMPDTTAFRKSSPESVLSLTPSVLRHPANPSPQTDRMFFVRPTDAEVFMDVTRQTATGRDIERDVILPADEYLDILLREDPTAWKLDDIFARDFRGETTLNYKPFARPDSSVDVHGYLGIVQDFSAEILQITE